MKMLTVGLLVCAVMALSTAEALPQEIAKSDQVERHLVKRWTTSCSSGWTLINGRCFRYVPEAMTWAQAERNCESMNGTLASVHSGEEYYQLQLLVLAATHEQGLTWILDFGHGQKETWIGGSNAQEETVWFWSDGSPFLYSNWCPGEPNNFLGQQHCLHMNHSARKCWDDFQCSTPSPSICVKRNK